MQKSNLHSVVIVILSCLLSGKASAQVMTADDVIAEALKKNYSIQVQKNFTQIAANDVSLGNAGILPQLNLNGGATYSNNNTKQLFLNGTTLDRKGAISTGVSAGAGLTWVLFDGLRMFAAYDRLKTQHQQSLSSLKIEVENTIAQVLSSYYDLVRQKQLIRTTLNSIALYEERLKIAETKWKIGSSSKLDYLQSKVDLNAQRSQLLTYENNLRSMKLTLNLTIGREADTNFDVEDSIVINYNPKIDELKTEVIRNNNRLAFQQQEVKIAEYTLKETRSLLYPRISLGANYAYNRTENQAGFVLLNENLGLNGGITASWNIFAGGNNRRLIKNSEATLLNTKLNFEFEKTSIQSEVLQAYYNLESAHEILKLEEDNYLAAKENAEVALEAFRLGTTNSLLLKEAQQSFDEARVRLVNVRYAAKVAEITLRQLNGELVR